MAFNNVPANGWPQIKKLEELDAIAQKIDNLPTFTSTDRDWLDDWESKLPELPADPETDGVKVLTATTESGETVKSWEEPTNGGVDYSTDEVNTGRKWIDNNDIYSVVLTFNTPLEVSAAWVDTGLPDTNIGSILDVRGGKNDGAIFNCFSATKDQDSIRVIQSRGVAVTVDYIILEYTKVTT